MNDIILNHDSINFNEIEKVVFGIVCEAGLSIVKGIMENLDEELFNSRDKKKYAEAIEKLKEFIDKETDEKAKEELKEVFNYYNNNFDVLIRYQDKKDILLPQPPNGIEFKGLGTMESSIRNVLVLRMKNNGTAWSISGANHMSKLLCLKHSGDLHEQLKKILKNSKVVDFIDINKMIIDKLNESKRTISDEVKILLKQQKKPTKYNENIQSSIIYGQGKVTRMQQILKGLSTFDFMNKIL